MIPAHLSLLRHATPSLSKTTTPRWWLGVLLLLACCSAGRAAAPQPTRVIFLSVSANGAPVTTVPSGTVVTLTATLSGSSAVGQVTFCDASAPYCTDIHLLATAQVTSAGTATFKFIPGIGVHQYRAVYLGIGGSGKSISAVSELTVTGTYPTTTTIAQSGTAGDYMLTATVVGTGSETLPLPGSVSFLDTSNSNGSLGSASLGASTAGFGFLTSATQAVGDDPRSVAACDFNGDGIPDLAVANQYDDTVTVLLGNGEGTFTQKFPPITVGSEPTSLAVGDFNGDGILDLAVANLGDSTVTVLLGNGYGAFSQSYRQEVGGSPGYVMAGDFNRDGIVDLVTTNFGDGTVTVMLGNGDGTFYKKYNPTVGDSPYSVAVDDFNRDGIPDLAVANYGDNTIVVLLGNGDGTFTQKLPPVAVGSEPTSLAVGDFNGDGIPDLAVADFNVDIVTVLLGNGDGTFTQKSTSQISSQPQSVAVGDFNGDGIADLAVGSTLSSQSTVTVLLGNGDGSFYQGSSPALAAAQHYFLAVGDFNGDGIPDLAVTDWDLGEVTILLTQLTQTATASVTGISPIGVGFHTVDASYPGSTAYSGSTSRTVSLSAAPVTTGLVLNATPTSGSTYGQQVTLSATLTPSTAQGDSTDGEQVKFYNGSTLLGTGFLSSGVASVNVTSLPVGSDSLTASYAGDTNFTGSQASAVLYNVVPPPQPTITSLTVNSSAGQVTTVPSGTMVTLTATLTSGVTGGQVNFCDASSPHCTDIHLLATAQVTGAGTATFKFIPGIGVHQYKAVYLGNRSNAASASSISALTVTGTYPTTTTIAQSGTAGSYGLTATVVGTGSETLPLTGSVSFLDTSNSNEGLGTASLGTSTAGFGFITSATPATGAAPNYVAVGDFNGDGIPDLAVANGGGNVTVLLGKGDGTFPQAQATTTEVGIDPASVAVGDFNGDGILDLVVVNYGGDNVTVLLGKGDGTFPQAQASTMEVGSSPTSVAVGDFNGDGIPDLAVANSGGNVTVLLGNGEGTFTQQSTPAAGFQPSSVVVGDFNGDGIPDLAVANKGDGTVTVLLGSGDGFFTQTSAPLLVGPAPLSVAVGDFNGDGIPDLAVANYVDSGTVTVLLGSRNGTFTQATTIAVGSYPYSVAVGDLNRDGIPDLAVANGNSPTVTILLGQGDGTFTSAPSPAIGTLVHFSLAVTDFNGDGIPDLAVSDFSVNNATVLLTQLTQTATASLTGISPVGVGLHAVDASYPANTNYSGSTSAAVSLSAAQVTTRLLLIATPASGSTYGQPVTLTANLTPSAAQGNSTNSEHVTFKNGSTVLGTGTLAYGMATLVVTSLPVGANSLTASYLGDTNFQASSAQAVPFTVSPASQTITFTGLPTTATYSSGLSYALNGTASSGLAVSYAVSGPATLSGSVLNITGAGTISVTASQAGNTNYSAAPQVTQTVVVSAASQSITFTGLPQTATYSTGLSYSLNGTASSGLAVSYTVSGPATLSGSVLNITGAGTVSVTASQAGNTNYSAAPQVTQTVVVSAGSQTISFGPISSQTAGASLALTASASSGLTVSFASLTPAVCTVMGSTAALVAAGTCTIQATQAGNGSYGAATPVSQSFTVNAAASFTITPLPAAETINRGVVGAFLLELKSVQGFQGNVTLSCSGGPVGSKCVDFPQIVKLNGTALALTGILFPMSTPPSTYTLTFTGVSGSVSASATAQFTVK